MTNKVNFPRVGGIKKFLETSGLPSSVSQMNIRQIIKTKYRANQALKDYDKLFSDWKKRLAYQRYFRAVIVQCNEEQKLRREKAIEYYYSLPESEHNKKNWNKYTSMFSGFRQGIKGQDKLICENLNGNK